MTLLILASTYIYLVVYILSVMKLAKAADEQKAAYYKAKRRNDRSR